MTPEEYARRYPRNTRAHWYDMREAAYDEALIENVRRRAADTDYWPAHHSRRRWT